MHFYLSLVALLNQGVASLQGDDTSFFHEVVDAGSIIGAIPSLAQRRRSLLPSIVRPASIADRSRPSEFLTPPQNVNCTACYGGMVGTVVATVK